MVTWWWLSFADPDRPKGQQHLGVSIVCGGTMQAAVQRAWMLGLNPGGQVMGYAIEGPFDAERALTAAEMATLGERTTVAEAFAKEKRR